MTRSINRDTAPPQLQIFEDSEALAEGVAYKLLRVLKETVEADGIAHVSLTGGGSGIKILRAVAQLLGRHDSPTPAWEAVHFWWGDERLLAAGDSRRNETQAREALLDALITDYGLPSKNVHPMPDTDDTADPHEAARMYARDLARFSPSGGVEGLELPTLAVMLLGVGPDGHINSLFPWKETLNVTGQPTAGESSAPRELGPPLRVTLTFDAVHTARRVWLGVTGVDKAEAAAKALAEDTDCAAVPAANARGKEQTLWHLDRAAAAHLTSGP